MEFTGIRTGWLILSVVGGGGARAAIFISGQCLVQKEAAEQRGGRALILNTRCCLSSLKKKPANTKAKLWPVQRTSSRWLRPLPVNAGSAGRNHCSIETLDVQKVSPGPQSAPGLLAGLTVLEILENLQARRGPLWSLGPQWVRTLLRVQNIDWDTCTGE